MVGEVKHGIGIRHYRRNGRCGIIVLDFGGLAVTQAQRIDGPSRRNGSQPGQKGPRGVVGCARTMHGEQHILHYVIDPVGGDALATRHRRAQGHAGAQQRLVGRGIARLGRDHQGGQRNVGRLAQLGSVVPRPREPATPADSIIAAAWESIGTGGRGCGQDPLNQL